MEKGNGRKSRLFRAKRAFFASVELISTATESTNKFLKIDSNVLDLVRVAKSPLKSVSKSSCDYSEE